MANCCGGHAMTPGMCMFVALPTTKLLCILAAACSSACKWAAGRHARSPRHALTSFIPVPSSVAVVVPAGVRLRLSRWSRQQECSQAGGPTGRGGRLQCAGLAAAAAVLLNLGVAAQQASGGTGEVRLLRGSVCRTCCSCCNRVSGACAGACWASRHVRACCSCCSVCHSSQGTHPTAAGRQQQHMLCCSCHGFVSRVCPDVLCAALLCAMCCAVLQVPPLIQRAARPLDAHCAHGRAAARAHAADHEVSCCMTTSISAQI